MSFDEGHLIVNGKARTFCDRDPNKTDWGKYGTEIVIDPTGAFRTIDTASAHLRDTVKKVIITAPSSDAQMIVMGVNQDAYDPSQPVVSNASCTTNCLAPVTKVIHDNFTIAAAMTTVHAFTNDQNTRITAYVIPRRARGCTQSIVPTSGTGAAKAMGKVIPALNGKMNGFSVRIPTPNVSLVDVKLQPKESPSVEEVNALLKQAAEGELPKGILGYSDEPLVSIDYNGDLCPSIVDGLSTMKAGEHLIKVVAWYDNEWVTACAAWIWQNSSTISSSRH